MIKRSKHVMIKDILQCISSDKGANKTSIIRKANLDYEAYVKNIKNLTEKGFISKDGKTYHITKEGKSILEALIELLELIGEE